MNLVIIDDSIKKYHPYPHVTHEVEMFICGNINMINKKNDTFLIVQVDCNIQELNDKGYTMDQTIFDKLIWNYNDNLQDGEKKLDHWIKF